MSFLGISGKPSEWLLPALMLGPAAAMMMPKGSKGTDSGSGVSNISVPSPVNANEAARQAMLRKRKISLLTGGNTKVADDTLGGQSAIDTSGKTLLGG